MDKESDREREGSLRGNIKPTYNLASVQKVLMLKYVLLPNDVLIRQRVLAMQL